MDRRDFLRASAGAAAIAGLPAAAASASFTFVHFTDTHIQPELRAMEGCEQCFEAIKHVKPDFAISGGDMVFDALEQGPKRVNMLYDMYQSTARGLNMLVHPTLGNHDVFGLFPKSGVSPKDPMYGKKMYEDRIGKRYYSFDHKGWHFIVLDSIGMTPERSYIGEIDDAQLAWLSVDLKATGKETPIVVVTHIPLVSGFPQYLMKPHEPTDGLIVVNTREVLRTLSLYNVKAVLQGHTHIRETVDYKGCKYITSGAVCGNWWRGLRAGHPEGFAVLNVKNGEIDWSYHTYGWKAAPKG